MLPREWWGSEGRGDLYHDGITFCNWCLRTTSTRTFAPSLMEVDYWAAKNKRGEALDKNNVYTLQQLCALLMMRGRNKQMRGRNLMRYDVSTSS